MKGGAIPFLAWSVLIITFAVINGIWEGRLIQSAMYLFAILVLLGSATALVLRSRGAAARVGPPPPRAEPVAQPRVSAAAPLSAVGLVTLAVGFAFGKFLVDLGAALLVIGASRWVLEILAQRRSVQRWRRQWR
jgi:hypothetical protein